MNTDEFAKTANALLADGLALLLAHAGEEDDVNRYVGAVQKVRAQYRAAKEAPAPAPDVYDGPVTSGMRFQYKDSVFVPDGRRGKHGEFLDAEGSAISESNLRGMYHPIPAPAPEPSAPPAGVPTCHPECGRATKENCIAGRAPHSHHCYAYTVTGTTPCFCTVECAKARRPLSPPPSDPVTPFPYGFTPAEAVDDQHKRQAMSDPVTTATGGVLDLIVDVLLSHVAAIGGTSNLLLVEEASRDIANDLLSRFDVRPIDPARSVPPGPVPGDVPLLVSKLGERICDCGDSEQEHSGPDHHCPRDQGVFSHARRPRPSDAVLLVGGHCSGWGVNCAWKGCSFRTPEFTVAWAAREAIVGHIKSTHLAPAQPAAPASEPAVRRDADLIAHAKVAALEAELAEAKRAIEAAHVANTEFHAETMAARAEVEQLRVKLAEQVKKYWRWTGDQATARVRSMREAEESACRKHRPKQCGGESCAFCAAIGAIRALPLDTGTATDASGEAQADAIKAAVAPHVCKCSNGPCPRCGGTGPEGEWFEGSEVACVDCGAALIVATVEPCPGSSTFEAIEEEPEEEDDGSGEDAPGAVGK